MDNDIEKLTDKQRAAYLANGFNATQAAIKADYSTRLARSIGSENLTIPNISTLIGDRMKALTLSVDEALFRLSQHARASIGDFINPTTGAIDLLTAAQAGKLHLIKKLSVDPTSGKVTIELYDAQAALIHILCEQHLRAGEATGRDEVILMTDEQRVARITALLDSAKDRRDRG